jgi:hypothetical protein
MGVLSETWKDILLLVGALGPLVLAVIAVLIAGWQIIQAHQHSERIHHLGISFENVRVEVALLRKDTELNRIYSDLMRLLAINLMSTDAIQESRIRILESRRDARKLDPVTVAKKIDELSSQYQKLVEEISLLSGSKEVRRQSILSLGAGAGDMATYELLHALAKRLPENDEEGPSYWKAIGMIRERIIRSEKLHRDRESLQTERVIG